VLSQEQTSCLVSPLRQELLGAFIRFGPAAVDEIAQKLGRRAKSLYYHVDLMERVGLLRKVGERPTAKRPEALYDAVSERVLFDPSHEEEVRKSVQGLVRMVGRELGRVFPAQEPAVIRITSRLSPADRDELVRKLENLAQWAKSRDNPEMPRISLTQFMVPLGEANAGSSDDG
jgi:predicted transcriptional regulator